MPHPHDMPPEQAQACFCLLKPDAIERGLMGKIFTRIEEAYLRIQAVQQRRKSQEWVRAHYAHIQDPDIVNGLVVFMTAVPIIGFIVSGPHAIARMRKMAGSTNSIEANPGTIRGDFGNYPIMYNCIHVSDSAESAEREWKLFYDPNYDAQEEIRQLL